MKNINRRIVSFLLCLTVAINTCGCKQEIKTDMVSAADSNNRAESLEVLLQENINSLADLGIMDVVKLDDKQIDEIINSSNVECTESTNTTIDELVSKIRVNSANLAKELPDLEYTSFFSDGYFENMNFINKYYYTYTDEDMALIKDAFYNALYSYLGFVLSTGTNEDIHSFQDLSIVFVPYIKSGNEDSVIYGVYSYANNVVEISLTSILNDSNDINSVLARIDETVKHELSHVRQSACRDKLENGGVEELNFLNGYNHSFLTEASAESILYNLCIEGGFEKLGSGFTYTYEYYRRLENKLLLCSLLNDYSIEDYYKAINNEDINALFSYLNANTLEEKKEIFSIIYTMDALEGRNTYIMDLLGNKDTYDKNDIFKICDTLNNLHYISIFKIAISNLIKYDISNNDLDLEDNVLLYYLMASQIADGAFIVDDTNKDEEIYYCYDKFCEQYKIIQDSFFSALSTIYHVSNDDIEVIYNKYKKVNMKDVFMDINFGYDGESLTSDNSHLVYSKLNRLLEKFPKIKEIIGNSYLYTDINEESSLKMLDDVQVGRILVKKIRDSVNEEAN